MCPPYLNVRNNYHSSSSTSRDVVRIWELRPYCVHHKSVSTVRLGRNVSPAWLPTWGTKASPISDLYLTFSARERLSHLCSVLSITDMSSTSDRGTRNIPVNAKSGIYVYDMAARRNRG